MGMEERSREGRECRSLYVSKHHHAERRSSSSRRGRKTRWEGGGEGGK
jgi:hypothetical protein